MSMRYRYARLELFQCPAKFIEPLPLDVFGEIEEQFMRKRMKSLRHPSNFVMNCLTKVLQGALFSTIRCATSKFLEEVSRVEEASPRLQSALQGRHKIQVLSQYRLVPAFGW